MITIEKIQSINKDKIYYNKEVPEKESFSQILYQECAKRNVDIWKLDKSYKTLDKSIWKGLSGIVYRRDAI